MTGSCRIFYANGSFYEGKIVDGVREGFGKFIWPNGAYYEGFLKNNRFEGGGTF